MGALFALNYIYVERKVLVLRPWRLLWRPLAGSAAMALIGFVALRGWSDIARALLGLVTYGLVIVLLRTIPPGDWERLFRRCPRFCRLHSSRDD
jgi:hypothetical protein